MPSPPSTLLLDDFSGADENPITTNWTSRLIPSDADLRKASQRVLGTNSGATTRSNAWYDLSTFLVDQECYATVAVKETTSNAVIVDLFLRVTNPGTTSVTGYVLQYFNATGTDGPAIYKFNNTTLTNLGFSFTNTEIGVGDSICFQAVGSVLACWLRPSAGAWTLLGSGSDSTYSPANSYIGLGVSANIGRIDDFSGGSVQNVDSAQEYLGLSPSSLEEPAIGSRGTVYFALTPSVYETLFSEFGTEPLLLVPSSTDIHAANEVMVPEYLALTPIGLDDPQYPLIEAGQEYLALTPDAVEVKSHVYTDTNEVYLEFNPEVDEHLCFYDPNFEGYIVDKWDAEDQNRWQSYAIERWSGDVVEGGVPNPC